MFDFTDVVLDKIAVHKVGNKQIDEKLTLSKKELLPEDWIKDLLIQYFLKAFKHPVYWQFQHQSRLELNEVYTFSKSIFGDESSFFENSVHLARHLFDMSNHPNIKGGEFYVCHFKELWIDDEEVDGIGLFKSENKENYLKVYNQEGVFEIDGEEGININKLDKGCLIFNKSSEEGYKVCVVDNTNRSEDAIYWKEHFLNVKAMEDEYYQTKNYLKMCKGFVEDVYNKDNEIARADQIELLNSAANYFKEREKFDEREFETEVLEVPENIQAFQDYKNNYQEENEMRIENEFSINENAFKDTKRYMKSVLKLDKNFHVYIHGKREYIERGYDDKREMSFYKLFFEEEN